MSAIADPILISAPGIRAEVLPFGATLVGVWVGAAEMPGDNLVLRLPDLAEYRDPGRNPYLGSTVGRFSNRIAGSRIEIDGVVYQLVANEGPTSLHGGPTGWSYRDWEVADRSADSVLLRLTSADRDMGFPGTVQAEVRYRVGDSELTIEANATTDAPTVVSMTNHAYWNLDGGQGVEGIDTHRLSLRSRGYLEVDTAMIPTGRMAEVEPLRGAEIGTWDHWFELDDASPGPAAVLNSPAHELRMSIETSAPGVQVYTANALGEPFGPRRGICLEACTAPDSAQQCVLLPGDTYYWSVRHRFERTGAIDHHERQDDH